MAVLFAFMIFGVVFLGFQMFNQLSEPADQYPEDSLAAQAAPNENYASNPYALNGGQASSFEPSPPVIDTDAWYLILVSPRQALPEGFSVELEYVNDSFRVDTRIADPLRHMIAAARGDGIILTLRSAYRSVDRQHELFYGNIQTLISQGYTQERAVYLTEMYFARPGYSEHHTGLAVDILSPDHPGFYETFEDTLAFAWLSENAHLFGFILRYPRDSRDITGIAYEPWHFRYVGVEAATEIFENGWVLEEFLYFQQFTGTTGEPAGDAEYEDDDEYEDE